MTAVLRWSVRPRTIGTRWRGNAGMAEAVRARPSAPIASIIGPVQAPGVGTAGFGGIDYSDLDEGSPINVPANEWAVVARNLQPSPANFNLPSGPWEGFEFWRDGMLRARALGDFYLFKFAYRVTPNLRGATLTFAVRPGGNSAFDFGPNPSILVADAGEPDQGSLTFLEQARSRFVTQGAQILVKISSGGTLDKFSPEIVPLSYAR